MFVLSVFVGSDETSFCMTILPAYVYREETYFV